MNKAFVPPTRASDPNPLPSSPEQAEEELRCFFAGTLDLLCLAGLDGYFKRLNPAWETTLGWTIGELLGRPFIEFVHPDDRAATLSELEFQEAEATGIGLTDSQQARLDQIAAGHEADLEELKPYGLSWDSLNEEQVDLERRLTEAMLLRQNLVAATDAVAPNPDRAVQARYEEALDRMLGQLKAEADIDDRSSEVPASE